MAVKLNSSTARPVTRETACTHQGRPILVRLEVGGRVAKVKQKGLRRWHIVAIDTIFWAAVANTVASEKARKRAEREARRREKQ